MEGPITAYNNTTGSLTVNVDLTNSSAAVTVPPPVIPGYLSGLTLSNDISTPATVLDVAPGGATSDDNTTLMILGALLTKNCNAAFAPGIGGGALDSSSALAVSTWYHVFLIQNTTSGLVDTLISKSAGSPSMPSNYSGKRRIGSIKTDSSAHILGFTQVGDDFVLAVAGADYSGAITAGANTLTLASIPVGIKVIANFMSLFAPAAGNWVYFLSPDQPAIVGGVASIFITIANQPSAGQFRIRSNINGQIIAFVAVTDSSNALRIGTIGWTDNRGK
jgi:hypothetical protein